MEETVAKTLSDLSTGFSLLAYLLVFLGGVITSIGPCNLSMVPVIMAYVGGDSEASRGRSFGLSLAFTLGSSFTFMMLGVMLSLVGGLLSGIRPVLYYLVAAVCLAIGLNLLGLLRLNIALPQIRATNQITRQGIIGAFLLGLVVGLAGSQCGTPVLVAILSLVMAKGLILYGATLLFVYGLGRGVPVVLAGTFTGVLKSTERLATWSHYLERGAGLILIAVGLYFVWAA